MAATATATIEGWATHLGIRPDQVDPDRLRKDLASGSLPEAFTAGAAARPAATVRVGDDTVRQGELHDRAARVARVLLNEGITRGDRVILCAGSSIPFLTCYLGALWAGATVVLANPAYTSQELARLARSSAARLMLADGPYFAGLRSIDVSEILERATVAEQAPMLPNSPDDIALLAYTSGTTGAPKGVPLTHGNLLSSIRAAMLAWRWSPDDILVHALPLFHQHGLSGVHASLIAGSDAVVLDKFDPHRLIEAARGATVMFAVPSIHTRMLELPDDELEGLRGLRLITSGSAPLAPSLERSFAERVGVELLQRYGLTESGLDISNPYDGERVPGSVGFAFPGVEAALYDVEGEPSPSGSDGEICLRGPQVFAGYLDDEAATEAAFWPGGWFRTGDLGRWESGRLVISGRLKELIITGGMNVVPREVELVIEQYPGITDAAVAGLPSEQWGEEVTAWIVAEETVDPAALIAHCRTELATYKCPKRVIVVHELPRNALGKVVRGQLTETMA